MSFINFLTKTDFSYGINILSSRKVLKGKMVINQTVLFKCTRISLSKDYAKFNAESREK